MQNKPKLWGSGGDRTQATRKENIMNKYEYAQEVCKLINAKGYQTEVTDHYRNNGSYVAITVRSSAEEKVAPVFTIGDEAEDPVIFAQKILEFIPAQIDTDSLEGIMFNKEEVLSRTNYILVNTKLNESRTSLVRRPINETLELQYKIDISDIVDGGRILLEHKHIETLGITDNELYVRAYANTMEKYPYCLQSMGDILPCGILDEVPKMYVLTNNQKVNGAGAILYSGMKKVLDETVGECIVIPSSVHEMIIIPSALGEKETLTTMIRDVNSSVLSPEDVLSDRPYELIADGVLFEV